MPDTILLVALLGTPFFVRVKYGFLSSNDRYRLFFFFSYCGLSCVWRRFQDRCRDKDFCCHTFSADRSAHEGMIALLSASRLALTNSKSDFFFCTGESHELSTRS